MNNKLLQLYLILDPDLCGGAAKMIDTACIAAQHGATLIQLRAPQWKKKQWYDCGMQLKNALDAYGVPLIVNNHIDIALAIDAAGVHIGQQDMPVAAARRLLGDDKWLGLSISNAQQMAEIPLALIDYIGIGPVFPTRSKADAAPALGLAACKQLLHNKPCPAVAIGGINQSNAAEVMAIGADGIAVISAICGQANVAQSTQQLIDLIANTEKTP